MSSRLLRLGAAALLASAGAAAQDVPHFEMDYVFPRNETYSTVDILPVALAIQNLTAVRTIGDFKIIWAIMPYRDGVMPTGVTPAKGLFEIPEPREEDDDDEPYVFVDYTNVTEWIGRKSGPETYAMQFYLQWYSGGQCDSDAGDDVPSIVIGHQFFSIESPGEAKRRAEDRLDPVIDIVDKGKKPDLMDAVGCPTFGSVSEIRPNTGTNSSCPIVVDEDTGREPNPCGAKVDKTVASSIANQATSMAEAAVESRAAEEEEKNRDREEDGDEEDAASGGRASLTAVAAAFGLGLLALAL